MVGKFVLVLRGPAGAGKTTLAEAIRARVGGGVVAVIETDIFNWQIVPGETDKRLVYDNVLTLSANYLRAGRSVIVAGLILRSEEAGAINRLRGLAAAHRAGYHEFYSAAPRALVRARNRERLKDVPDEWVARWWKAAEADRLAMRPPLAELDMRIDVAALAEDVLHRLDLADSSE
jgi:predicted kinase